MDLRKYVPVIVAMTMLSSLAVVATPTAVFAWDVRVEPCTQPGELSTVYNPKASWNIVFHNMFLFDDGGQAYGPTDRGDGVDAQGGWYEARWQNDKGEWHQDTYKVYVKSCPPLPQATLSAGVSCVAGKNGVRNTLQLVTDSDTNGRTMTLGRQVQKRIGNTWAMFMNPPDLTVEGQDQLVLKQHIGRGEFTVKFKVTLGDKTVERTRTVRCAPKPEKRADGEILGPCLDPWFGGKYINIKSTRPVNFGMYVDGQLRRSTLRKVQGGKNVIVGPIFVKHGALIQIIDGSGTVYDQERSVGGNYGKNSQECQLIY